MRLAIVASTSDPSRECERAVLCGIWPGEAKTLRFGTSRARYRGLSEKTERYGEEGTTRESRTIVLPQAAGNGDATARKDRDRAPRTRSGTTVRSRGERAGSLGLTELP